MSHSRMVAARDVVRILRLRDELDDLPPDINGRWLHVLEKACPMFGAVLGAAARGQDFVSDPERSPRYLLGGVESGWLDHSERQYVYRYFAGDQNVDPCVRALASIPSRMFTRFREQLIGDTEWYSLDHVNTDRRGARVDAVLFSARRLDRNGNLGMIALHRPWGERRPFNERDRTLLHLLHRAVTKKLYVSIDPLMHVRPLLSPRLLESFELLMRGLPEKQVAARLGVTKHTLHGYVKEIYRRLCVESRPELMAKYAHATPGVTDSAR